MLVLLGRTLLGKSFLGFECLLKLDNRVYREISLRKAARVRRMNGPSETRWKVP